MEQSNISFEVELVVRHSHLLGGNQERDCENQEKVERKSYGFCFDDRFRISDLEQVLTVLAKFQDSIESLRFANLSQHRELDHKRE